jgi:diaminohydroxyphosphoribosylaminopyrimidine deaminase/5-amino-6-(5-phosphoribosylamino)uracil reductase
MDAIIVGSGTARADNPLLTARPPGPRTPLRIVLDSRASLPLDSQLVRTARDVPVLVATGPGGSPDSIAGLEAAGVEVWRDPAPDPAARLVNLWRELGRRRLTNVLVEGGSRLLGSLFDARLVDEVHVFIAPRLTGGGMHPPLAGVGVARISEALSLESMTCEQLGADLHLRGRVRRV